MLSKHKKAHKAEGGLSSNLIRKPIKKWFPLFMGPTIICFCIGFIWPFIQGIYLSFCQFTIVTKTKFVGFENYIRAFNDPSFVHAFWYTALYTVVSVVLINLFAFAFALALTQKMKGSNLFRTVFFMPNLIGGIVLSYIWSMIFDGILSKYGTSIIMDSKLGFWGLVIVMCWQQIGYMMIIYIAGLQAIPGDMLEAAEIDGASKWQTLIRITIPNVMSSVTICTFLSLSNGFKLFDQNLALTNGYPVSYVNGEQVSASEMLALNIYSTYMSSGKYARGTAQAKAVIFFILVAAIGLLQLKFTRKKEVQQ
jgi:raffinose/stachyose/melibiose transport system permease protein